MNRLRNTLAGASLVALVACTTTGTTTTLNPALVQDGNLAVAAFQALGNDATLLGAPPSDVTALTLATSTLQTALADLQKGAKTPQDFATLFNDEVNQVGPTLLKDLKANQTITTGVALLESFVTIVAADATPATTAPTSQQIDKRAQLQAWVAGQKR